MLQLLLLMLLMLPLLLLHLHLLLLLLLRGVVGIGASPTSRIGIGAAGLACEVAGLSN